MTGAVMMRILIIEDDAVIARSLAEGLAEEGFGVKTVGTDDAALLSLAAATPVVRERVAHF